MAYILIIEPDTIIAEQYRVALTDRGHEVSVCHDAQHAILSADKRRPDVIMLEVLLAAHSGIEFLYELRSYPEWQSIPVIVTSRARAEDLGLTDNLRAELNIPAVLYKPDTSLKRLVQVLSRTLTAG